MKAPGFWNEKGIISDLLIPFSVIYFFFIRLREFFSKPAKSPIPVICIGNAIAGGAGKTPVAIAIGKYLSKKGHKFSFITRGYGGRLNGPVEVKPDIHSAEDVGDEALLLARIAPCFVSVNRHAGAEVAAKSGSKTVILDDGLQNNSIIKNLSILVVDGGYGFGNKLVIPAGPLRDSLHKTISKCKFAVVIGEDENKLIPFLEKRLEVFIVTVEYIGNINPEGRKFIAFAGIARPEKFFNTLRKNGFSLVETINYADHYPFGRKEVEELLARAKNLDAELITTEKDHVRLPEEFKDKILTLNIEIKFPDEALDKILSDIVSRR